MPPRELPLSCPKVYCLDTILNNVHMVITWWAFYFRIIDLAIAKDIVSVAQ